MAIQTIEAIDAPMIIEGISMDPTVLQRSDGLHVPSALSAARRSGGERERPIGDAQSDSLPVKHHAPWLPCINDATAGDKY